VSAKEKTPAIAYLRTSSAANVGTDKDMVILAVQLLLGIAGDHCFEQGNKRTGFVCAVMFLELNGYEVMPTVDSELLGELVTRVIARQIDEEKFIVAFRTCIRPLL
jgi:death-on-curing family protein